LKLNDTVLTKVDRCKYLGEMIDSDLKWQSHIDLVYSRLLKFTGIFYKIRCYLSVNVLGCYILHLYTVMFCMALKFMLIGGPMVMTSDSRLAVAGLIPGHDNA